MAKKIRDFTVELRLMFKMRKDVSKADGPFDAVGIVFKDIERKAKKVMKALNLKGMKELSVIGVELHGKEKGKNNG